MTDITYIWTQAGWSYLAVVLDLYSRAVVGWSLDASMSTALPLRALQNAMIRNHGKAPALHHSDRGSQYTSKDYRDELRDHGVGVVSMSRKENCWDNAVAESFFGTLKNELIHRESYGDINQLRAALFEYIEIFYNRRRLHSSIQFKTPAEVELAFELAKAA